MPTLDRIPGDTNYNPHMTTAALCIKVTTFTQHSSRSQTLLMGSTCVSHNFGSKCMSVGRRLFSVHCLTTKHCLLIALYHTHCLCHRDGKLTCLNIIVLAERSSQLGAYYLALMWKQFLLVLHLHVLIVVCMYVYSAGEQDIKLCSCKTYCSEMVSKNQPL